MSDCEIEKLKRWGIEAADRLWPKDAPHTFKSAMDKASQIVQIWTQWYNSLPEEDKRLTDDFLER